MAGILIAAFLAFVIVYFVGIRTSVIGVSMEPALYQRQGILINRFAYKLANPRAGDVVVFLPNGNQNTHYYVKRVVAGPGETVQIREGILYVNGKAVEDDTYDLIADAGIAEHEIKLGNDEYFVMGDNCNSSEDSRSGNIGPVSRDDIVGKAWFKMAGWRQQYGTCEIGRTAGRKSRIFKRIRSREGMITFEKFSTGFGDASTWLPNRKGMGKYI